MLYHAYWMKIPLEWVSRGGGCYSWYINHKDVIRIVLDITCPLEKDPPLYSPHKEKGKKFCFSKLFFDYLSYWERCRYYSNESYKCLIYKYWVVIHWVG